MEEVAGCPGCALRDAEIAALKAMLLALESRLKELEQKLGGKPPTRPTPELPSGPDKKPTGRKRGAQPGHPPHLKKRLELKPSDIIFKHVPQICECCQQALHQEALPTDREPTWHQMVELPPIVAQVTEHQGHYRTCLECGHENHTVIPPEVARTCIGDRITGFIGYLSGAQGMSKRAIEETIESVLNVPISLGTISNIEAELSESLQPVYQEAVDTVSQADVKNVDETGWKKAGTKHWLWMAATTSVAVFLVHPRRNLSAFKTLLNGVFHGILSSDRWKVYQHWTDADKRQLCWAHLKRNWEQMVERGGAGKRYAEQCLQVHHEMFRLWHLYRGGGISRGELDDRSQPLVTLLQDIILSGSESKDSRTQRFFTRLHEESYGLWTFLSVDGVEPTNNHGERVLRHAVLWRRRSFGCNSDRGCRYVERILTVVQTLRLQKRNVLEFLNTTIAAHRRGQPGPKLVQGG